MIIVRGCAVSAHPPLYLCKNMKRIIIILLSFLPTILYAQDISSILFSGHSVDYFGQLTDRGKDKEGLGLQKLKGGNLYAGSIRKNRFHGYGMMIAGEKGEIANCNGAYVYVGEWDNGIKKGKGTVYDRSGTAIYAGMFDNDAPSEKFPSEVIETNKRFTYLELDEDEEKQLYIGEAENGKPEGYGMTLDEEGFIGLSSFKGGNENGIGILIFPPNYWATYRVKDKRWFPISSSRQQAERTANNKAVAARERGELIQSLNKVLDAGTQIVGTIGQITGGNHADGTPVGISEADMDGSVSGNSGANSRGSTSGSKYNLGEQQSYNTDKQSWGRYDGMLSAHFDGGRSATGNEVKQWQQKMKDLRAKWKAKGKSFPDSNNENKSTANCPNTSHSH